MIRDQIILENNLNFLQTKCFACSSKDHLSTSCPLLHYTPNKRKTVIRYMRDPGQKSRRNFKRIRDKKFNSLFSQNYVKARNSIFRAFSQNFNDSVDEQENSNDSSLKFDNHVPFTEEYPKKKFNSKKKLTIHTNMGKMAESLKVYENFEEKNEESSSSFIEEKDNENRESFVMNSPNFEQFHNFNKENTNIQTLSNFDLNDKKDDKNYELSNPLELSQESPKKISPIDEFNILSSTLKRKSIKNEGKTNENSINRRRSTLMPNSFKKEPFSIEEMNENEEISEENCRNRYLSPSCEIPVKKPKIEKISSKYLSRRSCSDLFLFHVPLSRKLAISDKKPKENEMKSKNPYSFVQNTANFLGSSNILNSSNFLTNSKNSSFQIKNSNLPQKTSNSLQISDQKFGDTKYRESVILQEKNTEKILQENADKNHEDSEENHYLNDFFEKEFEKGMDYKNYFPNNNLTNVIKFNRKERLKRGSLSIRRDKTSKFISFGKINAKIKKNKVIPQLDLEKHQTLLRSESLTRKETRKPSSIFTKNAMFFAMKKHNFSFYDIVFEVLNNQELRKKLVSMRQKCLNLKKKKHEL